MDASNQTAGNGVQIGLGDHSATISAEEIQQTLDSRARDGQSYRVSNAKLQMLRAQNPFLPILPFPNSTIILALAGGAAQDVNLPSGTKLVYISGSGEYYISRNGQATIPGIVAPGTAQVNPDSQSGSFQNPEGIFLYVEEVAQFSIISPNPINVSIACYVQL